MTAEQEVEAICARLERCDKAKELARQKATELEKLYVELTQLCEQADLRCDVEVIDARIWSLGIPTELAVSLRTKKRGFIDDLHLRRC